VTPPPALSFGGALTKSDSQEVKIAKAMAKVKSVFS